MFQKLLPLIILVLLRFAFLDARPIHHDESVNGWFVDGMFRRGYFSYDPQNYHGPLFFYLLGLSFKIFGRSLIALRVPPVIFGGLVTFTPFLFKRWLGQSGAWIAALLLAVSPAMVFYSRYAIHETGFMLLSILWVWQWLTIRNEGFTPKSMIWLGLTLGGLACFKETFILLGAALLIAEVVSSLIEKKPTLPLLPRFWLMAIGVFGVAFIPIVIFFTGFFQDGEGMAKFFEAFTLWSGTGTNGNGHQKPFDYWIKIMGSLEWFSLAGLVLIPFAFKQFNRELRYLSWVGIALFGIYSWVSYKTPWCLLSFYWFFVFTLAAFANHLIEVRMKGWGLSRAWVWGIISIGALVSAAQAYDVAYQNPDQDGHAYIYGQTYHELTDQVQKILDHARADPSYKETVRIQVVSSFTWPLPFLLGEFKSVAYYTEKNVPPVLDGDLILMDEPFYRQYSTRLRRAYRAEVVRSRQWAAPMVFLTAH